MFYIRFTDNIYRDIEKGYSTHFWSKTRLDGLCAWSIRDPFLSPYATDDEIIEAAKKLAEEIAENTYGGYSSNSTYAVVRGTYCGSGNDGVLIKDVEVISIENL